jgi:PEP-CTERM/exosortase A-associated glycosyltransferase
MRILHVLDHSLPVHTGYSFRTRSILRQQHELGWETFQVTGSKHPQPGPDPETVDGLTFYRSAVHSPWLARLPGLGQYDVVRGLARRLETLVSALKPDVLHAHSPALNALAAIKVARRHHLPLVYECRAFWEDAAVDHGTSEEGNLRYRLTKALETRVFRQADAVTCICEGLRADIHARGIPQEKITVIPNAVDIEAFGASMGRDDELAKALGLDAGPVLGFLGSFYAYEGLDLAIDALGMVRRTFPSAKLLLVGGGFQEANLKAQAARAGLQEGVIFPGRVPHAEVPRYYDLVDILLYPRHSKRITELVTPLKPLEAMAQRRLLVASDVGGHRELIRDGETGRLFRAGDVNALAEAVIDLLEHRDGWERYRQAGREFVERERNWAASVAHYAPVYQALTARS